MKSSQRKCSTNSKSPKLPKKMALFPGMPVSTLPSGKKGWAEGFDLFERTIGGKGFLEKPLLDIDLKIKTNIEKNSEWWMSMLDYLQDYIVNECRLESEEDKKACALWFCGLIYIRETNPSYLQVRIDDLEQLLWTELEGDNFWNYNPVRLTSRILWIALVRAAMRERDIPSKPLLPNVPEQSVSDQSQAIHYVTTFGKSNHFLHFLTELEENLL